MSLKDTVVTRDRITLHSLERSGHLGVQEVGNGTPDLHAAISLLRKTFFVKCFSFCVWGTNSNTPNGTCSRNVYSYAQAIVVCNEGRKGKLASRPTNWRLRSFFGAIHAPWRCGRLRKHLAATATNQSNNILLLPRELPDQIHLCLTIRGAVWMEHLVKPHRRLVEDVGMLPRLPRQIRLRLTSNESPVDDADPLLLCDGQYRVKGAAHGTRHVFRADHWTVVLFQPRHLAPEVFRPTVVMKSDDVGLAEL